MFEQQLYLRCLLSLIGLWVTAAALAQPNQPIDVEARQGLHFPRKATFPVEARASEKESLVEPRLARIARRLSSTQAASSTVSSLPVVPSPTAASEAASSPLQVEPDAPTAVTMVAPIERQPLGQPRKGAGAGDSAPNPIAIDGRWLFRTLVALSVVIGCIFLLRVVLSRMAGRGSTALTNSPLLEVLARVSIGPRKHILLIRMGGRIVVVADSAAGLTALADIDDADEVASLLASAVASRGAVGRGFAHLLDRFNGDYRDDVRQMDEGGDTAEHRVDRARDQVSTLLGRVRNLNVTKRGGTA